MILIVEDNRENGELLKLFLERKASLKSMICTDGGKIIKECRGGEVELVIMDIQLNNTTLEGERVNGIELTRALKADPITVKIPVLLTTAHAMVDEREKFLREAGAEAYFTKPIDDYDSLIQEIQRWRSSRDPSTRRK